MRLKATGTLTPEVVEAVTPIVPLLKAVMREHYDWLQLTYEFYSVMGTSMDLSTMQKNQYVGEEGSHMWLKGMTVAAQDLGIEVQYCMALAHQILESAEFPAVTNARANGDGGLDVASLPLTGLLASIAGA